MQGTMEQTNLSPHWKTADWLLLLLLASVQFTHILDFMIMMPLGPQYMDQFKISPREFGLLISAYAFSAALAGLTGALLIDRFDRKHALLFLAWGFTAGTALCAVAAGYQVLLVGRCIAGFFGGMLGALVLAIVGDAFHELRRGLATGVIMSAFSVATIAGVPSGLFLADWFGIRAPFAALAILAAMMTLMASLVFPPMRRHLAQHHPVSSTPTWKLLLHPAHLWAYLLMIGLVLSMFTLVPFLATYLVANVGLTPTGLKLMYLFGGLSTLISLSVVGHLADRWGKLLVFRIMAVLTIVAILLITNMSPMPLVFVILITSFMMVVTSGRMVPAMAMITSSAQPVYRGRFMSVVSSVQQAASGLASLVAGFILSRPDPNGPIEGFPLVGILGSIATIICIILAGYVKPRQETLSQTVRPPFPSIRASSPEAVHGGEAAMTGVVPQPEAVQ